MFALSIVLACVFKRPSTVVVCVVLALVLAPVRVHCSWLLFFFLLLKQQQQQRHHQQQHQQLVLEVRVLEIIALVDRLGTLVSDSVSGCGVRRLIVGLGVVVLNVVVVNDVVVNDVVVDC